MRGWRVLVAVDDSPAGLRATRLAISLAKEWHAALRAVTVRRPGTTHAADGLPVRSVTDESLPPILRYVGGLAAQVSLEIELVELAGEPFRCILDQASHWPADLIVMGRSDRVGPGSPYLGSVTEHVLEFSECPVLVVPQDRSQS